MSSKDQQIAPPADQEMSRLLDTEDRVARLVADSRVQADRVLAEARDRSARMNATLEEERAAFEAALPGEIHGRLQAATERIRQETRARLTQLETIPAEQMARLARDMVDYVVAGQEQ